MRIYLLKNPEYKWFCIRYLIVSIFSIVCLWSFVSHIFSEYKYLQTGDNSSLAVWKVRLVIILIAFVGLVINFIVGRRSFFLVYANLQQLINGSEQIMSGEYDIDLPENGEGDISILGYQFNQMAKRLKLTLEQLEHEKENLKAWISDISHQLKTPIAALMMYNEILETTPKEDEASKERFLAKSMQQINLMEWLVQNLLKLSRLEAGMIDFRFEESDIEQTVLKVIETLYGEFTSKNVEIKLKKMESDMSCMAYHDKEWLGEAIRNILRNAIEYTSRGGRIEVILENTVSLQRIIVKDNGAGISEEDLPHIFDRFYRGNKTKLTRKASTTSKGSGIGLALAKFIVERHEGTIYVESRPKMGSIFTIVIPVK